MSLAKAFQLGIFEELKSLVSKNDIVFQMKDEGLWRNNIYLYGVSVQKLNDQHRRVDILINDEYFTAYFFPCPLEANNCINKIYAYEDPASIDLLIGHVMTHVSERWQSGLMRPS